MNVTMYIVLLKSPSGTTKLHPEAYLRAEIRDAYIAVCAIPHTTFPTKTDAKWISCISYYEITTCCICQWACVCGVQLYKMESQFFLENWHIAIAHPPSPFYVTKNEIQY